MLCVERPKCLALFDSVLSNVRTRRRMHICTYVIVTIAIYDGDATAAVLTLDIAVDEDRKMSGHVARAPARLGSRDGKLCYYHRLSFYSASLMPGVLVLFLSSVLTPIWFFSSCRLIRGAVICSSSASTCSFSQVGILSQVIVASVMFLNILFVVLVFLVAAIIRLLCPGMVLFNLPNGIICRLNSSFLCFTICDHINYICPC